MKSHVWNLRVRRSSGGRDRVLGQRVGSEEVSSLLALASGRVDEALRQLQRVNDWRAVASLGTNHQVAALCHWFLTKNEGLQPAKDRRINPEFKKELRLSYAHQLMRNEHLFRGIVELDEELDLRDVPAIYLKGPWLALKAYPELATRPIGDIDLCVREESFTRAVQALESLGYRHRGRLPDSSEQALEQAHFGGQLRFEALGRHPVELHFRIENWGPPSSGEPWLWDTVRTIRVGSRRLMVPGPDQMLLHLLLHANQHGFKTLRFLHDIRWALEADKNRFDLNWLLWRVRSLRCHSSVYHTLLFARQLAGASFPDEWLRVLRPNRLRRILYYWVWQVPSVRGLSRISRAMNIESPYFYLWELGTISNKFRFVRSVVSAAGGLGPTLHKLRRAMIG